jgi:glutamine---fructose-6-phosphate transaminase (isomerizing)
MAPSTRFTTVPLDLAAGTVRLPFADKIDWANLSRLSICACGTAFFAGLVAKYWFEQLARLPVEIDVASEFRYREPPLQANGLALFVSQSGETADTLACLRYANEQGQTILSVVNVSTSTIARESDAVAPTLAGPEISVASTKGFTCQLVTLACIALAAARARGRLAEPAAKRHVENLSALPGLLAKALDLDVQIQQVARELARAKHVLYLGRGTSFPLALEGALKLKELSYIHAEGYPAGELKHGPIALIDEAVPVIVVAPYDRLFAKTASNMQEVAARGGRVILVSDARGTAECGLTPAATVVMPDMDPMLAPIVYAVPMQMIAYHVAVFMGKDVDQSWLGLFEHFRGVS